MEQKRTLRGERGKRSARRVALGTLGAMYPLWDVESGDLTEEIPTLAAPLAAVRDDVLYLGCRHSETYTLDRKGANLVALALPVGTGDPSIRAS